MKIDKSLYVKDKDSALSRVVDALNQGLTPSDNFYCKLLGPITTPAGPDTEFTVTHSLGQTPTRYVWNVDKGGVVYDSRRANWNSSQMFLKCSIASATLYLIVF